MENNTLKKIKIKYNNSLSLYNLFQSQADTIIVIDFIYNHVYELIKEIKYIPHGENYNLAEALLYSYANYYRKVIDTDPTNIWLKTLFPYTNPNYLYNFSFRRFYIGLVGRIYFGSRPYYDYDYCFWYGEPANWLINHNFEPSKPPFSGFARLSCQFILLENYSEFQVTDANNPYSYMYYNYILFK